MHGFEAPESPRLTVVLAGTSSGSHTWNLAFLQLLLAEQGCGVVNLGPCPPTRDVGEAARLAWAEGADAVTVEGAEAGTGWAPDAFLRHVGLPLADCLALVDPGSSCLLVSGRMWEGARAVKCLALGARAIGIGRAALLAADESAQDPLIAVRCIELEPRLLISARGKYRPGALSAEDTWPREDGPPVVAHEPSVAGVQPSWQGGLP